MAVLFNFKYARLVDHGGDHTPVSKFRGVCIARSLKNNLDHRGFQTLREALPEGLDGWRRAVATEPVLLGGWAGARYWLVHGPLPSAGAERPVLFIYGLAGRVRRCVTVDFNGEPEHT